MGTNNHLSTLLKNVEFEFEHGNSSNWKNRDFEDLHFEILKKTKVAISVLTLKRIFGKIKTGNEYLPQKATIKALEQYANFNISDCAATGNKPESANEYSLTKYKKARKTKVVLITLFLIVTIILSLFVFIQILKRNKADGNKNSGKITLLKAEGFNPKTAYFEYTTPNNTDSFKILFDDKYSPLNIRSGNKKISYFFQYPGMYHIRMIQGKKAISDTIPILVETKGWQSVASYFDQEYYQRYYTLSVNKNSPIFHPSASEISSLGIDTTKIVTIQLDNFHPTGANGDNFTLQATVQNPDHWNGVRCNSVYLKVTGRKGDIFLRFTNPGCSHWTFFRLNEKNVSGYEQDLSAFAIDLTTWQQINVENSNKHISIYVNGVKNFIDSYDKTLGEIVGISIIFHGNGYVKEILLKDKNNVPLFTY